MECRMDEKEDVKNINKKFKCAWNLMAARKIRIKIRDCKVDDYSLMVASFIE